MEQPIGLKGSQHNGKEYLPDIDPTEPISRRKQRTKQIKSKIILKRHTWKMYLGPEYRVNKGNKSKKMIKNI